MGTDWAGDSRQLGMDGGVPSSQRGSNGQRRRQRFGACKHKPKFLMALENDAAASRRRSAPGPPPSKLTPLPKRTAAARTPGSSGAMPGPLEYGHGLESPGVERSHLAGLGPEEALAQAQHNAGMAAAKVRQAIWKRARVLPCAPSPGATAGSVLEQMGAWRGSTFGGAAVQAQNNSVTWGAAVAAPATRKGGGVSLAALAAQETQGLAHMLSLARCNSKFLGDLVPLAGSVLDVVTMGEVGLANIGMIAPERRRVMKLLRSAAQHDGDAAALQALQAVGQAKCSALLGMRDRPAQGQHGRGHSSSSHDTAWRTPKTTMDGAYYQAMQLMDGDSAAVRREQLEELVRRGASTISAQYLSQP